MIGMYELMKYEFKFVEVTLTNGNVLRGYVLGYESALDNDDDNEENIDLMPDKEARSGVCLLRTEIESIKIIDSLC